MAQPCKQEINTDNVLTNCPTTDIKFICETVDGLRFVRLPFSILSQCLGGGGGGFGYVTESQFESDHKTYLNPALNGSFTLFYNNINRFLLPDEYSIPTGGGFKILIPGFNASSGTHDFFVFPNSQSGAQAFGVQWNTIQGKPNIPILVTVKIVLNEDVIVNNPTSVVPFEQLTIVLIQGGAGGFSADFGNKYVWSLNFPKPTSLSVDAGAQDRFYFEYDLDDDLYYIKNYSMGFFQNP